MSNRKLTKFPVIAEDGTEYRITIAEEVDDYGIGPDAVARLYVKRRLFGFRKVFTRNFHIGTGEYNVSAPDYVRMVRATVDSYRGHLAQCIARDKRELQILKDRAESRRKLKAWDGRL